MPIALRAEVDELLLAVRASLDHHLLARTVRPRRRVALHLTFFCHDA